MKRGTIYLCIGLLSLIWSCDTAIKDYEAAKGLNTLRSFDEFIAEHPDHLLADSAKNNIERLRYMEAVNAISMLDGAYLFMKEYPESRYIDSLNCLFKVKNNCQWMDVRAEISIQDIMDFDDKNLHFQGHINYVGNSNLTVRYGAWKQEENLVLLKISVFNKSQEEQHLIIDGENSIIIKNQDGLSKVPLAVRFRNPPSENPLFSNISFASGFAQIIGGEIEYVIEKEDFVDFVCICQEISAGDILVLNKSMLCIIE